MGLPLIVNLLSFRPSLAGGAETYATELVPRLLDRWPAESVVMARAETTPWLRSRGWDPTALRSVKPRGSGSMSVVSTALAARRMVAERDAVVFSPFNIHTSGAPRSREVVGVHDLLSYHYLAGEWGRLDPKTWAVLKAKSVALGDVIAKAGAVVVHTEAIRRDVLRFVPKVDPARIHLVPLGADRRGDVGETGGATAGERADGGTGAAAAPPFVLLVGSSTWPHKNLGLAMDMARTDTFGETGARLVIVGRDVPEVAGDLVGRVEARRDISDAELATLYDTCSCLLFPSASEGFGLPLVEAMQRGVPCVVSDIAVFRELATDAARYFDPRSPEAAAASVAEVLGDRHLSDAMRRDGPVRAGRYTWDSAAEGYLAALRSLDRP